MASVGEKRSRGEDAEDAEDARAVLRALADDSYRCSITGTLMLDPVMTKDGQTYEREAIERWFEENDTSPNTGAQLEDKSLVCNQSIKTGTERIAMSGLFPSEESRRWMLRKAEVHIFKEEASSARRLLERSLALGEHAAGFHLGWLLLKQAADRGVGSPEFLQDIINLKWKPVPDLATLRGCKSLSEVLGGSALVVLDESAVERAFAHRIKKTLGYNTVVPKLSPGAEVSFAEYMRRYCGKRVRVVHVAVNSAGDEYVAVEHMAEVSEESKATYTFFPIRAVARLP